MRAGWNTCCGWRRGLDAIGLRHGDHLVTVLRNRIEAAALHWACQLAGVVITPVNWRVKPGELEYVLNDAGAKAICFEPVSSDAVANAPRARYRSPGRGGAAPRSPGHPPAITGRVPERPAAAPAPFHGSRQAAS